jgi:hypothetical protein
VLGGYRKYSIDCCTLAKLHCSCTTTYLDLLLLLLLAGPIALRPPVSCVGRPSTPDLPRSLAQHQKR